MFDPSEVLLEEEKAARQHDIVLRAALGGTLNAYLSGIYNQRRDELVSRISEAASNGGSSSDSNIGSDEPGELASSTEPSVER